MEKPGVIKRILSHLTKNIYVHVSSNTSKIYNLKIYYLRTCLLKTCSVTVQLALSALIVHSYGQALRNVLQATFAMYSFSNRVEQVTSLPHRAYIFHIVHHTV